MAQSPTVRLITESAGDARYVLLAAMNSYYSKTEADGRYLQSSALTPYYTKTQVDDLFDAFDPGSGGISDPGVPIVRVRTSGGTGAWQAADRDIPERIIIWYGTDPSSSEQQAGDIRWIVV